MSSEIGLLKVLWMAFLFAQVVFGALIFAVLEQEVATDPTLVYALIIPGLLTGAFALVGVPMFLKALPANVAYIIRWVCAEAVGLLGVLGHVVGGPLALSGGFVAVAVGLLVATRVTDSSFTHWEVRRLH